MRPCEEPSSFCLNDIPVGVHGWLFGPPQPSLPQADQAPASPAFPHRVTALDPDHPGGRPLSLLQFVDVFPILGAQNRKQQVDGIEQAQSRGGQSLASIFWLLLFIPFRMHLALFAAGTYYGLTSSLLPTTTPRVFPPAGTITRASSFPGAGLRICTWNFIWFLLVYLSRLSRSPWMAILPSDVLTVPLN